ISFSPLRSSSQVSADNPEEAMPAARRDLSDEADDTGNCAHTVLPVPSSLIAWMVPDLNPGWSNQKTSAPVPICTFSTKICESDPRGTIVNPLSLHWRAPAELNFCPETPLVNWLESSSVQNRNVSCVAGLYDTDGETLTLNALVDPTEPLCPKASVPFDRMCCAYTCRLGLLLYHENTAPPAPSGTK